MADMAERQSSTSSLQVKEGDVLSSPLTQYTVLEILGCGTYGKVAKCKNMCTEETVAVKIMLDATAVEDAEQEVNMLQVVASLRHPNILRFFEKFDHQGNLCIVFEVLHKDLFGADLEMNLSEIRPIAKQLFSALDALSGIGILHTDIKPDNVMLVGTTDLKVKLIDFGLAFEESEAKAGDIMQPVHHRSPEILLGLHYSYGIDVWGVGCLLASLYLQDDLFSASTTYGMMRQVVQLLGQPEAHLLCEGKYSRKYFTEVESSEGQAWRLKTPEDYAGAAGPEGEEDTEEETEEDLGDLKFKSLDDLVNVCEFKSAAEHEDRLQFVDLLKSLFDMDGKRRISAFRAGNHPFITMSHLSEARHKAYLRDAEEKMDGCYGVDSADDQGEDDWEEEQQVWGEEAEDGEMKEPEPNVWEQPIEDQWEEPSKDAWEASDSAWEETESVHLDPEEEGNVQVTDTAPNDQAEFPIVSKAVSGFTVATSPPKPFTMTRTTMTTTMDSHPQKTTFSQRLCLFWRNFTAPFTCCFKA